MPWADEVTAAFREQDIRLIAYVADRVLAPVIERMAADPYFRLVCLTREEEGVGVLAGGYLGGMRGALLLQSSGFGNTLNGFGSLVLPYQIPFVMLMSVRGGPGEFNVCQVPLGQALPRILDDLGIPRYDLDRPEAVAPLVRGAGRLAFATGKPVALLLSTLLTGGKGGRI
ncbi:MAG TPA: decarboxylase [Bacillota bacterium]|nr:decarboxylase [Bacillota bacterium]